MSSLASAAAANIYSRQKLVFLYLFVIWINLLSLRSCAAILHTVYSLRWHAMRVILFWKGFAQKNFNQLCQTGKQKSKNGKKENKYIFNNIILLSKMISWFIWLFLSNKNLSWNFNMFIFYSPNLILIYFDIILFVYNVCIQINKKMKLEF